MRLLLDQGLPRSTALYLQNYRIEAVHVGDRGLATASDSKILNLGQDAPAHHLDMWATMEPAYKAIIDKYPELDHVQH